MTGSNITVASARLRARDLLLASTTLVGFSVQPCQTPTVPPVAATLLRERIARWLALAVETPAALVARLNPLRIRKVRPAARIGRRQLRETLRAVAVLAVRARGVLARSGLVVRVPRRRDRHGPRAIVDLERAQAPPRRPAITAPDPIGITGRLRSKRAGLPFSPTRAPPPSTYRSARSRRIAGLSAPLLRARRLPAEA